MTDSVYLDHPGPIAFAHRGGASEAPENTLPAFAHAIDELGYRYIETDVHATADGVLIAFHDDRLDRVTDRTGTIADLTWDEVSKARVDGREPIPLLAEILSTWPAVRVNIDPKADDAVDPLIDVLRDADAIDRVCVTAFDDARIIRARDALGPGLCTGAGPEEMALLLAAFAGEDVSFSARCIQIPTHDWRGRPLATPELIETAHDHGLAVHLWTIDEPAEMERLLDLGVDGIMTDRPRVLRDVLVARGLWV